MMYLKCRYVATSDEITELEPFDSEGKEYLVRVIFVHGDITRGETMLADSQDLALWIFP